MLEKNHEYILKKSNEMRNRENREYYSSSWW